MFLCQARLAEEAQRLAAQQRAAAEAQGAAAATLRAVEEDIDEETEQLKAKWVIIAEFALLPSSCPHTHVEALRAGCGLSQMHFMTLVLHSQGTGRYCADSRHSWQGSVPRRQLFERRMACCAERLTPRRKWPRP
jgi:Tfp pilus assembly protein PilX